MEGTNWREEAVKKLDQPNCLFEILSNIDLFTKFFAFAIEHRRGGNLQQLKQSKCLPESPVLLDKIMKFSIKYFLSESDHIRNFRRIWSHLLKKS